MAQVIVGDTTESSTRIWVRGDGRSMCNVRLSVGGAAPREQTLDLTKETAYTDVAVFKDLQSRTDYEVRALFTGVDQLEICGRARTRAEPPADGLREFSFVLGSCNLSVVAVNNLLAFALAMGGSFAANESVNLRPDHWTKFWRAWPIRLLQPFVRWVAKRLIGASTLLVQWLTAVKQPGPPFLRSPFLKLSAVFEAHLLDVLFDASIQPPGVGDILITPSSRGVVAGTPTRLKAYRLILTTPPNPASFPEPGEMLAARDRSGHQISKFAKVIASRGDDTIYVEVTPDCDRVPSAEIVEVSTSDWSSQLAEASPLEPPPPGAASCQLICRVVVTHVRDYFTAGEIVRRKAGWLSDGSEHEFGTVLRCRQAKPWHERPDFFLHVGDQIYYDFPFPTRPPDQDEYRLTYREAWVHDDAARHLLAHWPNYMIFDDHEFADQYARDFIPPGDDLTTGDRDHLVKKYREESTHAYTQYVQGRNPASTLKESPFHYEFSVGAVHFFVLDTRTNRFVREKDGRSPQIIDPAELRSLQSWMKTHRDQLKFVITSVPFVAEIRGPRADPGIFPIKNAPNDTWSAPDFKDQRETLIDFIASERIERLVFLTGDRHCCYHASMRITAPDATKYQATTIHEIASGPLHQLQLAETEDFSSRCIRRTPNRHEYETVIDRFHTELNAVVHVKVEYPERENIKRLDYSRTSERENIRPPDRLPSPEVVWNVIRTMTDPGAQSWTESDADAASSGPLRQAQLSSRPRAVRPPDFPARESEPVMAGRISFVPKRSAEELKDWATGATAPSSASATSAPTTPAAPARL